MRMWLSMQRASLCAPLLSMTVAGCDGSSTSIGTNRSAPNVDAGAAPGSGGSSETRTAGTGGKSDGGGSPITTGGSPSATGGAPIETGAAGGAQPGTGGLGVTGGAAGAGTGGAAAKSFPCNNPTPHGGGFVQCEGNWLHRATKEACPSRQPRSNPTCAFGMPGNCTKDSDCTAHPDGYCQGGVNQVCNCVYPCHRDEECNTGEICECQSGACVPATCTTDADCEGGLCSEYSRSGAVCGKAFACQTPVDACATWADCGNQAPCSMTDGHRTCGPFCYASVDP